MAKRLPRPAVLQRFGRLRVLIPEGRLKNRHGSKLTGYAALCICDCGNVHAAKVSELYAGKNRSCGCLTKEARRRNGQLSKHGMYGTPEHTSWKSVLQRCTDSNCKDWRNYGGRGVLVCDRWRNSFEAFYADMGPKPGKGYSIERNDVNGNYEPSNCRWATFDEQANNKRSNVKLTHNGKVQTIAQWTRELGFGQTTIYDRLKKGWSTERALTTPAKKSARHNKRAADAPVQLPLLSQRDPVIC